MKIYIEVSGGMVQNVYAIGDEPAVVCVADYDVDNFWDEEDKANHEAVLKEFEQAVADESCRIVW